MSVPRRISETKTSDLPSQVAPGFSGGQAAGGKTEDGSRLKALGEMTGSVAHDLNNLLTVIIGATEALAEDLDAGSGSQDLALVSLRAAEHGSGLLRRLVAFAKQQEFESALVDCAEVVASVEGLAAPIVPAGITVEAKPSAYPLFCKADPAGLESALLNLCINARDAMPRGGVLTIRSEAAWVEGAEAKARGLAPGSYAVFTVRDTGVGMTPEVLARATEAYFTTKREAGGTGLGLSSVKGFARQLGGGLAIASRPSHGAVVQLYLPRIDVRPTAGAPSNPGA